MALFGDIPLPKAVPDAGPGGRAFQSYNALSVANLQNTKAALENYWMGPLSQADIQQKTSPVNLFGANAGTLAYLNAQKNGTLPQQIQMQQGAIPNNSLIGMLQNSPVGNFVRNLMGGGAQPIPQAPGQAQQQAVPSNQGAVNGSPDPQAQVRNNIANGLNADGTPAQASNASTTDQYGGNTSYGSAGSVGYGAANPGAESVYEKTKGAQAQNEADVMKSQNQQAQQWSNDAPIIETDIARIKDAYSKVPNWIKGPLGGQIPDWAANDPNRMIAQSAINDLASRISPSLNGGHLGVANIGLAQSIKPNVLLPRESLNEVTEFSKGLATRQANYGKFRTNLINSGNQLGQPVTSDEISNIWNDANTHDPFYDPVARQATNTGAWKNYSTPQALQEARTQGEVNPYRNFAYFQVPGDPRPARIPANQADQFQSDNPKAVRMK